MKTQILDEKFHSHFYLTHSHSVFMAKASDNSILELYKQDVLKGHKQ